MITMSHRPTRARGCCAALLLGWGGLALAQQAPATAPPAPASAPKAAVSSNAQLDAGEPRADTSLPAAGTDVPASPVDKPADAHADAHAVEHAGAHAAEHRRAVPAAGAARAADRLDLSTATVTGSQEQPKVMYVVPWKRSDIGDNSGKPINSLLDEALAPVDRDEFKREVAYYDALQSNGAQHGTGNAAAQGEK
jgi:hypothetical protein